MRQLRNIRSFPYHWIFANLVATVAATTSTSSNKFCSTSCTTTTGGATEATAMSGTPPEPATTTTNYTSGSSSIAFVTTPDKESATKLAHGIISRKLAACVNIVPQITSVYMWEGKINEDNEYLMMIKTRSTRIDELSKYVRENHSYSVAEVISVPIEAGNLPYLQWISQTVPEKGDNAN